ncbi:hypothetical protein Cva_00838 [Caedimonas varicaedens]|uniref:ATP-binding protein n=1 Tax=Caedimonas varicaedens TaxID=1629334 RepID=A0A0K8MCB3_9PROT|nr:hypothetical protein Cva_00838 [Caedimonas varicaedens]
MSEEENIGNNGEKVRDSDDYDSAIIASESKPAFTFNGSPPIVGKKQNPFKLVIYGANGTGKSTFAGDMEKPVFLDLEHNIDHLNVPRFQLKTTQEIVEFLIQLRTQPHDWETLVIDSIDTLESIAMKRAWSKEIEGLKEPDRYGAGYKWVKEFFENIVKLCEPLFSQEDKKMNIVFLGHETVSRIEKPGEEPFDSITPRIREKNYAPICNWVNAILYATTEIYRVEGEQKAFSKEKEKHILAGHTRKLYTTPSPAYLAKNVFDLPFKIDLNYAAFKKEVDKFYNQEGEK